MGVLCDRLKFGSKAALDCRTGQNKGRYCKKALLLLLVSLDGLIKINVTCHLATFAFSGISSDLPTFVIHFSCLYIARGGGPASRKEK